MDRGTLLNRTGILDVGSSYQEACVCSQPHGQHSAGPEGLRAVQTVPLSAWRKSPVSVAVVIHRMEAMLLLKAM